MKTTTKTTSLLIIALTLSIISFAGGFETEPEEYIDDIPFNTELVAAQALYEQAISVEFFMEEEDYINDIPFNTSYIVKVYKYNQAMADIFDMEEENYVDDIPFNTFSIALEFSAKLCTMIAECNQLVK